MVAKTLKEICGKFEMSKNLTFKRIEFLKKKEVYLVVLGNDSRHKIPKELINKVDVLGLKGMLSYNGTLFEK